MKPEFHYRILIAKPAKDDRRMACYRILPELKTLLETGRAMPWPNKKEP